VTRTGDARMDGMGGATGGGTAEPSGTDPDLRRADPVCSAFAGARPSGPRRLRDPQRSGSSTLT
jgi:hypothetical protein